MSSGGGGDNDSTDLMAEKDAEIASLKEQLIKLNEVNLGGSHGRGAAVGGSDGRGAAVGEGEVATDSKFGSGENGAAAAAPENGAAAGDASAAEGAGALASTDVQVVVSTSETKNTTDELEMLKLALKQQQETLSRLLANGNVIAPVRINKKSQEPAALAAIPEKRLSPQLPSKGSGINHRGPASTIEERPHTILELQVRDDSLMPSNFTLRAGQDEMRSKFGAKGLGKSVTNRHAKNLSGDIQYFMSMWREAREREIMASIVDGLRRAYVTLAVDDEECKELDVVLSALANKDAGTKNSTLGACQYLRERLQGSFLTQPEEKIVSSRSNTSPKTVSSIGCESTEMVLEEAQVTATSATTSARRPLNMSTAASSEADYHEVRESNDCGHATRKRFRKELARALRRHEHDPCVLALVSVEKPMRKAFNENQPDPELDIFDVIFFCEKYGDLDRLVRRTVTYESGGIIELVKFMRDGASEAINDVRGPGLLLNSPDVKRKGRDLAIIETIEDFSSLLHEDGAKQNTSKFSRIDACKWMHHALMKRRKMLDGLPQSAWHQKCIDASNLCILTDHCAVHTVASYSRGHGESGQNNSLPSARSSFSTTHESIENYINLYALFPGWYSQETLSFHQFISQWIVGFFNLPLTDKGAHWIRALYTLEPLLDVKVGGVVAQCTGISLTQEALIKGQCCMLVLPLQLEEKGQDADSIIGASDEVMSEEYNSFLRHHSLSQVVFAYHNGINPQQDTSIMDDDVGQNVGTFQLLVSNNGTVLLDKKHFDRDGENNTLLETLLDYHEDTSEVMCEIPQLKNEIIVQVATGSRHFLCLTADGRILAFGFSPKGQVGLMNTRAAWNLVCINADAGLPTLPLNAKVVQIACGADHSLCVVDNGLVYGFGNNESGQLGLPDTVVYKPSMLLKFERMSSGALLNSKGMYARTNFETIATEVPWIVSVACGDQHSVFLTASGQLFACGDNRSGQIGYNGTAQDLHDDNLELDFMETDDQGASVIQSGGINTFTIIPCQQFAVPVLLEGVDIPKSVAQVSCGSKHTSVLAHSGRVHVYGGDQNLELKQPSTCSRVWRTVHDNNQRLGMNGHTSSLVYHGDPNKILNVACCGDLTLVSYCDTTQGHSDCSKAPLNFVTFWWGQQSTQPLTPSLKLAQLHFKQDEMAVSAAQENDEADDLDAIYRRLCNQQLGNKEKKGAAHFRASVSNKLLQASASSASLLSASKNTDMRRLIELIRVLVTLWISCRSPYPSVREEAISLWGSADQLVTEYVRNTDQILSFADIVREFVGAYFEGQETNPRAKKVFIMGCQLILYRVTHKHNSMPVDDVNFLFSLGVNADWRPYLLHDSLWNGLTSSRSNTEPFVLLEEDVLSRKLEIAGVRIDHHEKKSIKEAILELAPRADLANLFLIRTNNVSNPSSLVIAQLLSHEYIIEIKTGTSPNAGTKAQIYIEIVGTNGTSGEKPLVYSDKANKFESGQTDSFSLACNELGRIKKVVVRMKAAKQSAWKLDEVCIWQSGNEGLKYQFPFYGWMDPMVFGDLIRQELWYDPVDAARDRYEYEIKVFTRDDPGAGTNARVFIVLHGELGDSKRQRLEQTVRNRSRSMFRRAGIDVFRIKVASDIGVLKKIEVGTLSAMNDASWKLDCIEVTRFRKDYCSEGAFIQDQSFAGLPTKFVNISGQAIGQDNICKIDIFPERPLYQRTQKHLAPPIISPPEGSFQHTVDVSMTSSEPGSEILFTLCFIPEDTLDGRVQGNDWVVEEKNQPQPQGRVEELVLDPENYIDTSSSALENMRLLTRTVQRRFYVIPETFYDAQAGFNLKDSVTYRMKSNSILKLNRPGGTYRVIALAEKKTEDGKVIHSDVSMSGEIFLHAKKERVLYRLHAFTGNFSGAGTSANVSVILKGQKGKTDVQVLDTSVVKISSEFEERETQGLLATGKRKITEILGLFRTNSESIFEFEANDVGQVDEIVIWHDNSSKALAKLKINYEPEWYLHRVEVVKPANLDLASEASTRVFMCRRWLTNRDTKLGSQARLLYSDLHIHEKLICTYDFAIVVPKASKQFSFDSLVLFGERVQHGVSIPLRKTQMEQVPTEAGRMYCLKMELEAYLGTLRHAIFKDPTGFVLAPKGLRLIVTCYERASYNTVHFVPSRLNISSTLSNISEGCVATGWRGKDYRQLGLSVCDRQQMNEPLVILEDNNHERGKTEDNKRAKDAQLVLKHKQQTRVIQKKLDIWFNIMSESGFAEDSTLQQMIPASGRLSLVSMAKQGALLRKHLEEQPLFNKDIFPMVLQCEIDAHSELAIMKSVITLFDKWRRVESHSYELEKITPEGGFSWNLLYWLCCTNPPDSEAIKFVLENSFANHNQNSDESLFQLSGLEVDFALLLHFLVLRQMAKYDLMELKVAKVEDLPFNSHDIESRRKSRWQRAMQKLNLLFRALCFPVLFLCAFVDILLNMVLATAIVSVYKRFNDWRMFSNFEDNYIQQSTKKEKSEMAKRWCQTCSGNYNWLNRSWPITAKERKRRNEKVASAGGEWAYWFFEVRREFKMNMGPTIKKVASDMSRWFSVEAVQNEEQYPDKKSDACRKRENALEQLCRLKPVDNHRDKFAASRFLQEVSLNFILLVIFIATNLIMLGINPLWDPATDLQGELAQAIVGNNFDGDHRTFNDIESMEHWWSWAHGSLAPWLMTPYLYNGRNYAGDQSVSPIRLRQVRVAANTDGGLPDWESNFSPGPVRVEAKGPLQLGMCFNESLKNSGCVWSEQTDRNAYAYGHYYKFYPGSGYSVQLTGETMVEKLNQLQDSKWLDAATRFVAVEAMVYSKSRDAMGFVSLGAQISVTGSLTPLPTIVCFTTPRFTFAHILYMFIFIKYLGTEALSIFELGPKKYLTSMANLLNLFTSVCIFAIFLCQMILIDSIQVFAEGGDDPWIAHLKNPTDTFQISYILPGAIKAQSCLSAITILIQILRFVKYFKYHPNSGPIVMGIFDLMQKRVITFFFLAFSWVMFGFSLCFFTIQPPTDQAGNFRDIFSSFLTIVRISLAGDFDFSIFEAMDITVGPILFLVLLVATQILWTNLLIAVISEEYDTSQVEGIRLWKVRITELMVLDLVQNLPLDSSGQIDMLSSSMLAGHDVHV